MIDVLVVGAGAAGLFCASLAGARGLSVTVVEHNKTSGKKIRISGGGRCNFTNLKVGPEHFLSANTSYARSALSRYKPADFIRLVDSHGIKWHEKTLGQLFCDSSAQQIIDMLELECRKHAVKFMHSTSVLDVAKSDTYTVETDAGPIHARNVVIATGGLSIPTLGASDIGYRIAKKFNARVIDPEPALVPLLGNGRFVKQFCPLAGLSFFTRSTAGKTSFDENILITHKGLSGPAILQASLYLTSENSVSINTLPSVSGEEFYRENQHSTRSVHNVLCAELPDRFLRAMQIENAFQGCNEIGKKGFGEIISALQTWQFDVSGTEGFAKAEVTRGGVDTDELSSKTMELKSVPGLYFIGEVVDVTGWLGGYNFQWAWSSGFAAGMAVV